VFSCDWEPNLSKTNNNFITTLFNEVIINLSQDEKKRNADMGDAFFKGN
jgi:hypothetical protein